MVKRPFVNHEMGKRPLFVCICRTRGLYPNVDSRASLSYIRRICFEYVRLSAKQLFRLDIGMKYTALIIVASIALTGCAKLTAPSAGYKSAEYGASNSTSTPIPRANAAPKAGYTGPEMGRGFLDTRISDPLTDGRIEHVQMLYTALYGGSATKEQAKLAFQTDPSAFIKASR